MAQNALAVVTPMAASIHQEKAAWQLMRDQADILVKTGFLPKEINTPEKAIAVMMKGRELGVPSMYALSHIAIVNGKPTCSAELMLALIRRDHGPQAMRVKASSNTECVVEWRTPGWDGTQTYRFTIDDAKQAGLLKNATWTSYPAAMLRARCISAVARMAFPESIAGMYSPGELGESVTVTEDGEVLSGDIIEIEPTTPSEQAAHARAVYTDAKRRFAATEDIDEKIAAGAVAISARETAAVLESRQHANSTDGKQRADDHRTKQNKRFHAVCADVGLSEAATALYAHARSGRDSRRHLTGQELSDLSDQVVIDITPLYDGTPPPTVDYANRIAAASTRDELMAVGVEMQKSGIGTDWLREMWKRRGAEVPAKGELTAPLVDAAAGNGEAGADKYTQ